MYIDKVYIYSHVVGWRACAARVTVVGFVCVSVTLNLTSRMSVRPRHDTIYPTGDEGQKKRGVFYENDLLQS